MGSIKEKHIPLSASKVFSEEAEKALKIFEKQSFPSRKTEDWRYAKLGKLINKEYQVGSYELKGIEQYVIPGLDADYIVLVNGKFNADLSKIKGQSGVKVTSMEDVDAVEIQSYYNKLASENNEVFTNINTAYNQGGVFIKVDSKIKAEQTIVILNIIQGESTLSNARNLIVAESFAEVNIVQGFYAENSSASFANDLTEFFVGKNGKVAVDKIQSLSESDKHICTEEVYQEQDSTFKINTFLLGGEFLRNGLNIRVDGVNCYTEMNGLFLGKDSQYLDNHTKVDHLKSNCVSSELYKGILRDKSSGVFNGKVKVHQDAQVIEAYQQNNNVILSDDAVMNTKPELEIYADDVKCSHGATTGQFDEEAIFYLQARGVSKEEAKNMLVNAFADEVLEKVENDKVRAFVESLI